MTDDEERDAAHHDAWVAAEEALEEALVKLGLLDDSDEPIVPLKQKIRAIRAMAEEDEGDAWPMSRLTEQERTVEQVHFVVTALLASLVFHHKAGGDVLDPSVRRSLEELHSKMAFGDQAQYLYQTTAGVEARLNGFLDGYLMGARSFGSEPTAEDAREGLRRAAADEGIAYHLIEDAKMWFQRDPMDAEKVLVLAKDVALAVATNGEEPHSKWKALAEFLRQFGFEANEESLPRLVRKGRMLSRCRNST